MFNVIFCSDCPFAAYMRKSAAQRKSFVRTVDAVRYAAMNYNRMNNLSFEDPRFIYFKHVRFYEERNELNEVAHMSFEDNRGVLWLATIIQEDE